MALVRIRLLRSPDEFRQCERIQRNVWGTLGVSSEVLSVTQKYGGAVIGAFVGRALAGFIYAFLARRKGRLIQWSHMMAVEPEYRDRGLGFRMKLAHREFALQLGIKSICWTYDPLQSRNATLNIRRLGARAEEYIPNCYGNFPSQIEKGLPSDRLVVNWLLETARVRARLRQIKRRPRVPPAQRVNETTMNGDGFLENRHILFDLRDSRLLVEIPTNTDEMRSRSLPLARRWRFEARRIFQRYLAAGYRVEEFLPNPDRSRTGKASGGEGQRCFYVLGRIR